MSVDSPKRTSLVVACLLLCGCGSSDSVPLERGVPVKDFPIKETAAPLPAADKFVDVFKGDNGFRLRVDAVSYQPYGSTEQHILGEKQREKLVNILKGLDRFL